MGVDVPNSIMAVAVDQLAHISTGLSFMFRKKNTQRWCDGDRERGEPDGQVGGGALQDRDHPAADLGDVDGEKRRPGDTDGNQLASPAKLFAHVTRCGTQHRPIVKERATCPHHAVGGNCLHPW